MTRPFKTAWVLLAAATILTLALTGFTTYNFSELKRSVAIDSLYCGTSNLDNSLESKVMSDPTAIAGEIVFRNNCKACHSLDKKIIGPALRNVYSRVPDEKWLRKWINNSSKMIVSGDTYAVAVFQEYNNMQMTNFTTMPQGDLDALMAYLKHVDSN